MGDTKKSGQVKTYRPGKTREDQMPVAKRPRVIAAQRRAERMK